MIPLRHRGLWVASSAVLVAVLVYLTLMPGPPIEMPGLFDKFEHFAAYFGLAVWFAGLYPRARYLRVGLALLALGLALEIAQGAMELGRSSEALDMVANAVGVVVGLGLGVAYAGNWARRVEAWLNSR